jgi:hypothetical protein
MTTKKDEQAREAGYYDPERIGFDYNPDLAPQEESTLKVKRGGRMVTVEPETATKTAGGEMRTPVDAAVTTSTTTATRGTAKTSAK